MAVVKTLIGNIKGPKGDTGAKGDTGEKGDTGSVGQRGSRWTQGIAITGTSTTDTVFSDSGISDALVNDNYLNTSTGNTYRCTAGGDASTAMWVYSGNIKGVKGDTGAKGDKGDTGATGPKGEKGEKGDNGENSFADHDTATSGTSFTDAEDGNMLITDWTKNLLKPTLETYEQNGITCTRNVDANGNFDGTYTLNGTATANFILNFINRNDTLDMCQQFKGKFVKFISNINDIEQLGKSYMCIGQCNSENWSKWGNQLNNGTIDQIDILIYGIVCDLHVFAGDTFNNVLIKPMLTTDLSATYDDFVPYGGYEIQSCGKNLANPNKFIENKVVDWANGSIVDNDSFFISDYIEVEPNTTYTKTGFRGASECFYYDENKNPISNVYGIRDDYTFMTPSNSKYVILSGYKENMNIAMLEKGSEPTDFEPYTGETITVTNDTESPAFGLKSHKGITNIISPGNVKCVYPTNESGVAVLEKERQLNDNKSDVVIDTATGNKVVFTIENGIICAREA